MVIYHQIDHGQIAIITILCVQTIVMLITLLTSQRRNVAAGL